MTSKEKMLFDAENCNRKPITAGELYENPDLQGYMYSQLNAEAGLDPWTVITGMDRLIRSGLLILEYGQRSDKTVSADYIVFIKK